MGSLVGSLPFVNAENARRAWRSTFEAGVPPKFRPFLRPARYKAAYGGRGSSKSHSFGGMLIARHKLRPGTRSVCVREVQESLQQSVKLLLSDKIKAFGLEREFVERRDMIETPGGGMIIFKGMQEYNADNIKSLEGFDTAWVEEAHGLSHTSLNMLRPTLRKEGSEIWFTWNPRYETDAVDQFFRGEHGAPPDTILVETGYQDNPYFTKTLQDELDWDRRRDPDTFAWVWLGAYLKNSSTRIFKNWRVTAFDLPPHGVPLLFGGDWGFAQDPTCSALSWLDPELPKTIRIGQEAYKLGCEIDDTPALFDELGCAEVLAGRPCGFVKCDRCAKGRLDFECKACQRCKAPGHGTARAWVMTADNARPETISYLQRHGYPLMKPAIKGPNSVMEGIKFLQNYDLIVHPRCVKTINELTLYSWKTDKRTGQPIPEPVDKKNHVIDQLRYAIEDLRAVEENSGVLVW